jgi:segregation and condensation protein B
VSQGIMSRDGKITIGPPRLSVVETGKARSATANVSAAEADATDKVYEVSEPAPGVAANDSTPADTGSASPVHDLIQSIEGAIDPVEVGVEAREAASHSPQRMERIRVLEAVIFASHEPVLSDLQGLYRGRGVNLVKVAGKWAFRTAEDLSWALERHSKQERRLSKAALETLAIVAYHQPVTRAEIEEVRGVTISKGTLDVLMEIGWVRPRGRRRAPGKPITYGTTEGFLAHFGLDQIRDLPGIADLKAQGLLDANLPPDFKVPEPTDVAALMPDELPLESGSDGDEPLQTELELEPLEEEGDEGEEEAGDDRGEEP